MKKLIIGAVLVYFAAAAVLFAVQRKMMYFPSTEGLRPEQVGLEGVSIHQITTADGETLVLWYAAGDEGKPTILFLHGNAGEIGHRADRFRAYRRAGFGVAFLSWRGYGGSSGSPSEHGLRLDSQAAFAWLRGQGIAAHQIAVIGESLGTGLAVQLAVREDIGALVLGAPYTATSDVAARQFPWLPVRWLMKDQYRSIDHIAAINAPLLILHGRADDVIPFDFGQRLSEAAKQPKTFLSFEGRGHDMLFAPDIWEAEIAFLNSAF